MSVPLFRQEIPMGDVSEIEKQFKITLTSGQKSWITNRVNLSNTFLQIQNEMITDFNTIVTNIFQRATNDVINAMAPTIPVRTGRMKAAFIKAFVIKLGLVDFGSGLGVGGGAGFRFRGDPESSGTSPVSTLVFDVDQFFVEVPYARFHISEFTGFESYKLPTDPGTRPMEFIIMSTIFKQVPNKVKQQLTSLGWDIMSFGISQELDRLEFEIEDALSRYKGGSL